MGGWVGGWVRTGRGDVVVDKDEDGLLGREANALADHVGELPHAQVGGDQVPGWGRWVGG